ncbi:MAG TPA: ABC transporter permease [Stellaceae bacterium]|nr:ABC transporter permease [Stellaceae bacterium]
MDEARPSPAPATLVGESGAGAWPRYAAVVAVHVALLILWQLAVDAFAIRPFILPSPLAMLRTLAQTNYRWADNTAITAAEIFGGFALAVVLGVALALLFSWSRLLTLLLFPLFVTLNMIPKVALGPLIIVWLSYGPVSNILITFSLCLFPILLTTARGLREVEPDLLDLVRALKGSRWQIFAKIQLPGALPYLFSGMKVAAILAVAGAVVGEFIASDRGLGYLMIQVQSALDTAAMFMAVILLTALGVGLYLLALLLERLCIPGDARLE